MNVCYVWKPRTKRQDCYSVMVDTGKKPDGKGRQVTTHTFHGTKAEVDAHCEAIRVDAARGEYTDVSRITVTEHVERCLESVKRRRTASTYRTYETAWRKHLKATLGGMRLQALRPSHVEDALEAIRPGSRQVAKNLLNTSMLRARRDELIRKNPVEDAEVSYARPVKLTNFWEIDETQAALRHALDEGTQPSALIALALDSGARKGELLGAQWTSLDLAAGTWCIERQIVAYGRDKTMATYGPTKTRNVHTVKLSGETVARLRTHRRVQAELRLANGRWYLDEGLIFAHELRTEFAQLGEPLSSACFRRMLDRVIAATGNRRITIHGLRHTCATLLIAAGLPITVVAERLGHAKAVTTLNIYTHVLKTQTEDASSRLSRMLYGDGASRAQTV